MRRALGWLPFVPLAAYLAMGVGIAVWMESWRLGRTLWDEKEKTWLL